MSGAMLQTDERREFLRDSLDISRFRKVLWSDHKRIVVAMLVGVVLSFVYFQISTPNYNATAVVGPTKTSADLGTLGGIASLSSIGNLISMATSSDYDAYNELLSSVTLGNYIATHDPALLHRMFSSHWDANHQHWTNSGVVNKVRGFVRTLFGAGPWQPPNGEDVQIFLQSELDVSNDYKTNFTTISYSDHDPQFAKDVVSAVCLGADAIIRARASLRSSKRIAYLNRILPTVTQADQHDALIQALATEEQNQMMTQADPYYSINPVSLPSLPTRPSGAGKSQIIFAFTVLAFLIEYLRALYLPDFHPLRPLWSRWRKKMVRSKKGTVATDSA